jgi:putative transposase
MILGIQQDLKSEGIKVTISQLCRWFEVPRPTAYYKPCKSPPKVQERFEAPIKAMIDQDPSFGYRTVAGLLKFNKNTVHRIFQIRGWQVKQRPIGFRPRVQAMPSVAKSPDERWATDLCRVWTGRDGWASLAVVIDCYTREILGWHLELAP